MDQVFWFTRARNGSRLRVAATVVRYSRTLLRVEIRVTNPFGEVVQKFVPEDSLEAMHG